VMALQAPENAIGINFRSLPSAVLGKDIVGVKLQA